MSVWSLWVEGCIISSNQYLDNMKYVMEPVCSSSPWLTAAEDIFIKNGKL